MARQKRLKMRIDRGSVVWVGPTALPVQKYRFRGTDSTAYYVVRMWEPFARVTGAGMIDRPPIELLDSMGIKVRDHGPPGPNYNPSNYIRYHIVGCRIDELKLEEIDLRGIQLHELVVEHMRQSILVANNDVEVLLKMFDEPKLIMPDLVIPRIELLSEPDWLVV